MANIMRVGGGASAKPKKLLKSLANGSTVSVLEDGKLTQFLISHNYEPDLNGEGRTLFARKLLPCAISWYSTKNNAYAGSNVDTWLNGDYKNTLSAVVKSQMGITSFKYTAGNGNTSVSNLQRSVFVLSATEYGMEADGCNIEGEALPIASLLQIGYSEQGTAVYQWTRTPETNQAGAVKIIMQNGTLNALYADSTEGWIRPCFTLPSNMALKAEPLSDGSWVLADEELLLDTKTAKTTPKSGVSYTNGIADLDAATLHEIGKAISSNPKINNETSVVYYDKGNVHRKISVGDTIENSIDGATYAFNIIGFNHDDLNLSTAYETLTATGKAGISFQMVNCLSTKYAMHTTNTNSVGWTSCAMRTSTLSSVLGKLSTEMINVIKNVKKYTAASGSDPTIKETDDKLFLLAEIEVFGVKKYSASGEGSQYAYYKAGNSNIKNRNGSAEIWFLRSPYSTNSQFYCCVDSTGIHEYFNATDSEGVAFAYCI